MSTDPSALQAAFSQVGTNTGVADALRRLANGEGEVTALEVSAVDSAPTLGSTNVQGQLDAIKTIAEEAGMATMIVFQPGGVANNNVFTTWADVVTAVNHVHGAAEVFFDNTHGAPVISSSINGQGRLVFLPATQAANGVTVTVADGVTITDLAAIENNLILTLTAQTVSPLVFTPAPNPPYPLKNRTFLLFNGATLTMASGALVPGCVLSGMQLVLEMLLFGLIDNSNTPTVPLFDLVSGGSVDVTAVGQANITGTEFGGGAGTTVIYSPDASCPAPSSLTLPNFTGSFVPELLDQANVQAYTPGTPGSWAAPEPTTVAQGLDRLAAAVAALRGSPVP